MSSLFKLSIQGVRSFDCESSETIQFGFPLTLICGQNGCGKTTIIECLKYATTGDLPPNSKGGAFVIDPEIVSRNNVTAQVKLAFKDVNGRSMITTRSMQLTKKRNTSKAGGNTFKTLEGQLAIIQQGNKQTLSTKNAELDSRIPIHLGASKAILDYVIFCHQDDSLWPLSEASVLKKRFDEIFEASKFTKVLDNLKDIRKEMTTDIRLIEQNVKHMKLDKDRSRNINEKVDKVNEQIDSLSNQIITIKLEIEKKDKEAEGLFVRHQEYQQTLAKYDQLIQSKTLILQQLERFEGNITILDDSYEDLVTKKDNFNKFIEEKESLIQTSQLKLESNKNELKSVNDQLNELTRMDGFLKSKETDYLKKLKNLNLLVENLSSELDYLFDTNESESKRFETFQNKLSKKIDDLKINFSKAVSSNKEKDQSVRKEIQEILGSMSQEEERKKMYEQETENHRAKVSSLRKKIGLLESNGDDIDIKKAELESLEVKYTKKINSLNVEQLDGEIRERKKRLTELETEVEEINKNISLNNRQSDMRAKLEYMKESKKSKELVLNKLISNNSELFKDETGKVLDPQTCNSYLIEVINEKSNLLNSYQGNMDRARKDADYCRTMIDSRQQDIIKIDEDLERKRKNIEKIIKVEEIERYEDILKDAEDDYNITYENLNTFDVSKQFKIRAIEIAEKQNHCQLCQRSFDESGLKSFVSLLKSSLELSESKSIENDFKEAKKDLEEMKSIRDDIFQYKKLNADVKEIRETVDKDKVTFKEKEKNLQEEIKRFKELSDKLEILNSLRKPVGDIHRVKNEIKENDKQLNDLEKELSNYGVSDMSLEDLQTSQSKKNLELKILRQEINDKTDFKYSHQKEISRLEANVKDMKLTISNLESSFKDIKNFTISINESNALIKDLESRISKSSESLDRLKESFKENQDKLDLLVDKIRSEENEKREYIDYLSGKLTSISDSYISIMEFEKNEKDKIQQNSIKINNLTREKELISKEIAEMETNIQSILKEVSHSSSIEHNIIANIDYRDLKNEVTNIEDNILKLNIDMATTRRDEYQKATSDLREVIASLNADYASKSGEIKQLRDQIKTLRHELESDYKDIDKQFHEEWVKLQANLLISNDIQTYSKALDNAIMKYHSMKMEDINRILKELWSQTYKGTDIDSIAIKSDVNIQAKGNRSYNYRVVMYKSNAELDMRGRCSAGQKVLTSILIRLALAECFGVNCGMIALDEPTTNLDTENAESLAQALNQIISFRKSQRNFQLIVITHDEKFLSHINGDRFADHFYRIQRDENQKSTIYSLPISKIHDTY